MTFYPDPAQERRDMARLGLTYWTARCNCYRGGSCHSPNSGRCTDRDFYTPEEREGICPTCWEHCGHKERHQRILDAGREALDS